MTDVKQQGIVSQKKQEVAKRKKPQTLKEYVEAMSGQIAKALPKVMTPERFTRIALTALSSNPKLAECDRNSFLGGLMQSAQLGLEPNTPLGQAYLIPYRNNKRGITECQFQVGYKGLIDLAYRGGEMQSVSSYCVYDNDEFEYELGLEPKLVHKPAKRDRGDLDYVYAIFRLKNGGYGFEVMSVDDVMDHAKKYSQAYKSGYSPWKTNFEEMAKKTVLKKVLKYAPIKTEYVEASVIDESTVSADDDLDLHVEYEAVEDDESDDDIPEGVDPKTGEVDEDLFKNVK